ncbi:MAG: MBL fold metallo-hydrolase [Desulfobacterales bacterium]|nr:MAG: MBL fold metallo-hydrolase [Desulfobacterales bacterium]
MQKMLFLVSLFLGFMAFGVAAQNNFGTDILKTAMGDVEITFIGHGSLMFKYRGLVIHVDPFSRLADYSKLPKAQLILITHEHGDHLDPKALADVRTPKTILILTESCAAKIKGGIVMQNGDVETVGGLQIEAVPAYNLVHMRSEGVPYHPKGIGNGYVINFHEKRVYIAGDTENIPEMKQLQNIDCAFLPMNLPYTMTPEMVADAAKAFMPKILYPYHYGDTDTSKLMELMKDTPEVEVILRNMK